MAGVDAHSVSRPFTTTVFKPKNPAVLGKPNPTTGLIASVPMNSYKVVTRKGVLPLVDQPSKNLTIRSEFDIPAGSDTADPANIRAAISLHIGFLWQLAAGLGDTSINNVM
jgi:hypothetical protein